jgi:transcriptional regulator with XRE-family HTH domain
MSRVIRLKEWREKRGLSQRALAEVSGVHYVSLARIEMGQLDPRLSTLLKLCKVLNVTLAELVCQCKKKGGQ